jgi:hypothetical protein
VKTPDHANIALKAITSNSARLIVSVTKSHPPANSTTKISAVVSRSRLGMRCMSTGDDSRSAAKPRTMPAATWSCRNLLVFSGMHPTRARFTPTALRQTCAVSGAPRRTWTRWMRRRSRPTLRA